MKTRTFIAAGFAVYPRTLITTLIPHYAWLRIGFLAFATIAFGPRPAQAAVSEAWVHRFTNLVSSTTDEAVEVMRDAAGDIIVTGRTGGAFWGGDMLTIKYSGADGSVLWQQHYNGPANGDDRPTALAVDGSGNVVVIGRSELDPGSAGHETYTAKYAAADGALLWERRDLDIVYISPYPGSMTVDGSGNVVVTGSSGNACYTAKYASADGALLWEKHYSAATYFTAVAVDGSGNVVVTGNANSNPWDAYTVKLAGADGALLWEKSLGPSNSWDRAVAVAVDGSGNVVVTGVSQLEWARPDYYTVKYAAADGALLWEQRYDDSDDEPRALAVDGSGNVVVTGSSSGDYYTAKYAAADGALLWEKRYNGPANNNDSANAVTVDSSGNVVVTGSSGLDYSTGGDYYTAKYAAADGALLWEKRYNGPTNSYDSANAVAVDGSGNVVVTGQSDAVWAMGATGGDYYTAKYAAADGALLWEKRHAGSTPSDASVQAVAVDGSGNVVVTGVAYNTYPYGSLSAGDYYTAKYAAVNGALLWEKRYNGPANGEDRPSALAVDGSGNVVVTGYSTSTNDIPDCYTAKYAAADGALLWEKRYNGPANGEDQPSALAVDGSGNVVVTGRSGNGTNDDYYTAKYAAADGTLLWEKRYNGPANGFDQANAVAVDGSGNVVVTGYSHSSIYSDYYTAKYAAADGALLWEKRYNGPANNNDSASALAVDASGNVVVTGHSYGSSTNSDYYTAKYAAADGALLWEKRYDGPANRNDSASALAVDASGNVVLTGSSDNGTNSSWDYYTAKYAVADGALLWEKRYNGPANNNDFASALAVDGSGNVVVTGNSSGGDTIVDYYTAKYAAADGRLLWEKRFTGPAFFDSSHCLALGPDGMVAVTGTPMVVVDYVLRNSGYATVVYREVPEAVSIDLFSTGVRLRFLGISGRSYNIERAPAVTGPWSTINTQTASASGAFEYLDTDPPASAAFYRASEP